MASYVCNLTVRNAKCRQSPVWWGHAGCVIISSKTKSEIPFWPCKGNVAYSHICITHQKYVFQSARHCECFDHELRFFTVKIVLQRSLMILDPSLCSFMEWDIICKWDMHGNQSNNQSHVLYCIRVPNLSQCAAPIAMSRKGRDRLQALKDLVFMKLQDLV